MSSTISCILQPLRQIRLKHIYEFFDLAKFMNTITKWVPLSTRNDNNIAILNFVKKTNFPSNFVREILYYNFSVNSWNCQLSLVEF